jgi:sulfonate transport system substrate-binding protein
MLTRASFYNSIDHVYSFLKKSQKPSLSKVSLLFTMGLSLTFSISACAPNKVDTSTKIETNNQQLTKNNIVRIGYQKSSTVLYTLKTKEDLEKAFKNSGLTVTWSEFPSGPPLLEALNAGSIDFGYTGEAPPVFAQAAGTPLVYVAYDPPNPKNEAILVLKDSTIKSVAELKGKKVAFAKGSNTNYFLVKALEKAGLNYSDIQPVSLKPADARAAFETKKVAAWIIWDPYLAAVQKSTGAHVIADATGLASNRSYYLAAKSFAEKNPGALKTVLEQVKQTSIWVKENPPEVVKLLSPVLGIDADVLAIAEKRHNYDVLPITDDVINQQQEVADTFYKIKLIPQKIKVKDAIWQGSK